ncbi:DUF2326 domain-containing protein [Actinobacillus pleuropneumoniae]|uniref:DUF2326 domain-containing protein n=1 Tax=Actinobacillus pleuropneumoniae TaxID=715 RepID=UPI001F263A19|nr:DUF2326 domain-containing protein [Actinobacillus pleuropneumoniae]UKH18716.1 DUF2326 domain-containing protein [Actinobacillus pleuropneumoniae]
MKISKLYSNLPQRFNEIKFNEDLNFIYGDVRHPKNRDLDSHNLGKTTLARLLDFMFLAKKHKEHFLFKNEGVFKNFIFFLEIKLGVGKYLTIKRAVENNTKISFVLHNEPNQDFNSLPEEKWDCYELSFDKAKDYLDGKLNFTAIKSWDYRKLIGYLIRTQDDFSQVFQLQKYRGKDSDWKPYMADLLGFDGELAKRRYQLDKQTSDLEDKITEQKIDEKSALEALSKADGRLLLRNNELTRLTNLVEKFNFREFDNKAIERLVAEIDDKIVSLNMKEYSIKNNIYHLEQSFSNNKIKFNPNDVKKLFNEVNILFPEQIKKDFEQLIAFNKAITKERNSYLKQELKENQSELMEVQNELIKLNEKRSKQLEFLKEGELMNKFRESNRQISIVQAEIIDLEKQKENIQKVLELQKQKRDLQLSLNEIQDSMVSNVSLINNSTESVFSKIRIYFNEIIRTVLKKDGELFVSLNNSGNFEFKAEYQESGKNTNESQGNTYRKFLCIAFDLAVTRAYLSKEFPKFIYIDGVFDGLDDRKKELLLTVLREYSNLGIQIIATTINSEIQGMTTSILENEIVLTLHDDGQNGRLFKVPIW